MIDGKHGGGQTQADRSAPVVAFAAGCLLRALTDMKAAQSSTFGTIRFDPATSP